VHRGPDDCGYYYELGQIGLGMRRLSIIDVNGGKQPIFNEDRTLVIVFNGEIYNFMRLRSDLEKRGHQFRTRTDTEVIIHGYEEYGLQVFEKLDGMFAVALWDNKQRRLILARDRIGIKPIYYTWVKGSLVFASEIKSMMQYPGFEAKIDLVALDGFLTYQYAPAPLTLFKGVFKLRPGHLLIVQPGSSKSIEHCFWKFGFESSDKAKSEAEWIEILEMTLEAAVRSHLVSDVPLGAFLSGGVDSSTIVALMARSVPEPVKTFTVGFVAKNPRNELGYARAVADYLGTDHHELMVTANMVKQLPDLIWHMDEPLGDPASLPTFFVSKLAKDCGVTVALSGEGADEMFAGYPKYAYDRYLEIYQKLPLAIRRGIPFAFNLFPGFEREKRLLRKMANVTTSHQRALGWRQTGFSDYYRTRLLTREAKAEIENQTYPLLENHLSNMGPLTRIQKMLQIDTVSWLPDDLLMKVDRMSMAASLEARVPYLDNNVVALAESMPDTLKLRGQTTKYLLKTIARKLLPASITDRAKHGFELPLSDWIRGDLGSHFTGLIMDGPLQRTGLFDQAYIAELLNANQQSHADHSHRIWMLGNLSLWLHRFVVKI
jgi:asparagine synthase (glutamine-hydrolysing)